VCVLAAGIAVLVLAIATAARASAPPAHPHAAASLPRTALDTHTTAVKTRPSPSVSPTRSSSPSPSPSPSPTGDTGGGCGWFDFGCSVGHAIDSWFAGLVSSAIDPLFGLLGRTLLSTPQVDGFGSVRGLWEGSLAVADACYVLLVLAGGFIVMTHQTLQTSVTAKELAPRLVTGFVMANLSLLLAGKAIGFANGLSAALAGQGLDPAAAGAMLRTLIEKVLSEGGMFFILLALAAVLLVLILAVIFVARLMLTVVLIAVAPLALACYGLPQTAGFARWWWRAFAGILAIQSAQALVFVAAMRIFFTDQWTALLLAGTGPSVAAAFDAVQLLCLLYILARIPSWIYRRVWASGGRSPVRTAARYLFAAAVLRRVSPVLSGRASRGSAGRGGGGPRGGGPGGGGGGGGGRGPGPRSGPRPARGASPAGPARPATGSPGTRYGQGSGRPGPAGTATGTGAGPLPRSGRPRPAGSPASAGPGAGGNRTAWQAGGPPGQSRVPPPARPAPPPRQRPAASAGAPGRHAPAVPWPRAGTRPAAPAQPRPPGARREPPRPRTVPRQSRNPQ
jgi:hypothetical protein